MTLLLETDEELGRRDIALTNLFAARGLPGGESIDVFACQRTLDAWAAQVGRETERNCHLYDRAPHEHKLSRNRFRILAMVTILQRDLHVHYRQGMSDLSDEDYFKGSEHLFIHGVLQGKGGGCSALPVAYAAVGRLLGYPLKLVLAHRHMFARWDDPSGEQFNIECTCRGFASPPDEHFADMGKGKLTTAQAEACGYLRSLTPRQELAEFLNLRGTCAQNNKLWRVATRAFAQACELDWPNKAYTSCFINAIEGWEKELKALMRPGFPAMRIRQPPRLYSSLPLKAERHMIDLEALERALTHPTANARWWEPLRRTPATRPPDLPAYIEVDYPTAPGGEVEVRYLNAVPAYSDPSKQAPW